MSELSEQVSSSIDALIQDYHRIAHNMANVNTTGYKRKVSAFNAELESQNAGETQTDPTNSSISLDDLLDFGQGSLQSTGRKLDIAVNGKGFLVVETPEGPLYTRNGVLQVNSTGNLVDLNGRNFAGVAGPVIIPPNISVMDLVVARDGGVSAGDVELGQLKMVDFGDEEKNMISVGENCYQAPEGVPETPAANAALQQGFQENSNVKLVEELVDLIRVSALYETNMKILQREYENAKTVIGVAN